MCKKAITNLAIPLATDYLPGLVSNLASKEIDKFERKANWKGAGRAGKTFTWFISNEDINGIIKIIKSREDSNVSIDSITELVKHKTKKNQEAFISTTSDFYSSNTYYWKRS